jgi:acyl carrier protein
MDLSQLRQAIFEALKAALPGACNDEMCRSSLAKGSSIHPAELGMDSLAKMESCMAIERFTGVTLLPSQLAELGSTDAIERRIRERLD